MENWCLLGVEWLCLSDSAWAAWAQAIVGLLLAVIAIYGPRREHQRHVSVERQRDLQRQVGILRTLHFACDRLDQTARWVSGLLDSDNYDRIQLRQVLTRLQVDDEICRKVPIFELIDDDVATLVMKVVYETQAMIVAVDECVSAPAAVVHEMMDFGDTQAGKAWENLNTAYLVFRLDAETLKESIAVQLEMKRSVLANL